MPKTARGAFEVKLSPLSADDLGKASWGRLSIDKIYSGDLVGTAYGQMLAIRPPVAGSAGYVAVEVVHATLDGKTGSFALQHSGVMDRGVGSLTVKVIPDSSTGDLIGLRGELAVVIENGAHYYVFDYTFADAATG